MFESDYDSSSNGAFITKALNQFFPDLQATCPEPSTEDLYLRETQRQLKWRQPYSKHTEGAP